MLLRQKKYEIEGFVSSEEIHNYIISKEVKIIIIIILLQNKRTSIDREYNYNDIKTPKRAMLEGGVGQ
jgi:hypothetical protein